MDALTVVESERILAVLEGAMSQLNLVSHIPIRRVQGAHIGLMSELNSHSFEAFNTHWENEEPVAEFERRLKGQRMGGGTPVHVIPPAEIVEPFRKSLKRLCSLIRDSSETQALLSEYWPDDNKGTVRLIETVLVLLDITRNACRVTKEEEDNRKQFLADLMFRIEAAEEGCRSLEISLADASAKKNMDLDCAKHQIHRLESTSTDLETNHDLIVADTNCKAEKERAEQAAASDALTETLQKRINDLEGQLEKERDIARDAESKVRRRVTRAKDSLASIVANYDKDMCSMMEKVKIVRAQHKESVTALKVAEDEFEKYAMDAARQAQEEAEIEAKNSTKMKKEVEIVLKVIKVQSIARSKLARRRVMVIRASGKKGKNKHKKKKGKG